MASRGLSTRGLLLLLLCVLLASATRLAARDTVASLEARLAREKDPAQRARIAARLATLQVQEVARAYRNGEYEEGGALLNRFLNVIENAERGLAASPARSRRKSKGFKELEISVRESIRQLKDLGGTMTLSEREPIEAGISRLEKVQKSLLDALFEMTPTRQPKKGP